MGQTERERKTTERDGARPDWLTMRATEFDPDVPMTQGALFAKPDRMGTPTLFGDEYGMDL